MNPQRSLHLVHSSPVAARKLTPTDRESISEQCLTHLRSRWNVARQFGVSVAEVNEVCDVAMFERGFRAGVNAERFAPADSPRTRPAMIARRAA
jgi:hypothetical protein